MTYRNIAPVPTVIGNDLHSVTEAYQRLARSFNALLDDFVLLKAQSDARKIQGVEVSDTAPTDNQVLTYDASTEKAQWETP